MLNQWILDLTYGDWIALGFSGTNKFIQESFNFASNFQIMAPGGRLHRDPGVPFAYILTNMEKLTKGLEFETYLRLQLKYPKKELEKLKKLAANKTKKFLATLPLENFTKKTNGLEQEFVLDKRAAA